MDSIDTSTQQGQLATSALELARRLRGTAVSQLVEHLQPQPQPSAPAQAAVDLYA